MEPYKFYDESGALLTASQAGLKNARFTLCAQPDGTYLVRDIMVVDHPIFNPMGFGRLGEIHRDDAADGAVVDPAAALAASRRRAIKRVRDLFDCNVFEWFLTFTLDAKKVDDRCDIGEAARRFNTYLKNNVQRYGWKYVAVPELHKKGGVHFHAVVSGDVRAVDSGTVLIPGHKKPVKVSTADRLRVPQADRRVVYNLPGWRYGYTTAIQSYGDRRALKNYVGKYITKGTKKIGGRWYWSGGELLRPMYEYANIDYDEFVGDVEFENDGGRFKIAYTDKENTRVEICGD